MCVCMCMYGGVACVGYCIMYMCTCVSCTIQIVLYSSDFATRMCGPMGWMEPIAYVCETFDFRNARIQVKGNSISTAGPLEFLCR